MSAEEAVEDEQEERDEEQADDRGGLRLVERVLAERGRDRGLVERDELDRQRTGLEHEREILRLLDVADPRDLGVARDAAGERAVGVVDLRPRANLAVEHDREVLRRVAELAAHVLGARDLLEAVAALVRELERHDRLVGRRVEVLARAGELQVGAGHLRHVRRVVLEEVVRVAGGRSDARAHDGLHAARDHHGAVRGAEELVAVRQLAVVLGERLLLRRDRADDELLLLVEDPPLVGLVLDDRLLAGEEVVDARARLRVPVDVDRRRPRGSSRGRRARAARSCR